MGFFDFLKHNNSTDIFNSWNHSQVLKIRKENVLYANRATHVASKKYNIEYSIGKDYSLNLESWTDYSNKYDSNGLLGIYTGDYSTKHLALQCYSQKNIQDFLNTSLDGVSGLELLSEKQQGDKQIKEYFNNNAFYYYIYFHNNIILIMTPRMLVPYDNSEATIFFEKINESNNNCANTIINSLQIPRFIEIADTDLIELNTICAKLSELFPNESSLNNFLFSLSTGTSKYVLQGLYNFLNHALEYNLIKRNKETIYSITKTIQKYLAMNN